MAGGLMKETSKGAKLAIGIVLLWFGGACLFVAFLSGKVSSLTTGKDQDGNPQGPHNVSELMVRTSENVQAAAGSGSSSTSSQEA